MSVATTVNQTSPRANSVRFPVQPRMLPPEKVARWLHLTPAQLRESLPALWAVGFPRPCSVTGNYDMHALDAWQDRRSGLAGAAVGSANADVVKARLAALG